MIGFALGVLLVGGCLLVRSGWGAQRGVGPLHRTRAQLGLAGSQATGWRLWFEPAPRAVLVRLRGASDPALSARLQRAGRPDDPVGFRLGQLGWAAAGAAVGALLTVGLAATGRTHTAAASLTITAVFGLFGYLLPRWELDRRIGLRANRVRAELPLLADLLALSVSAGLTPAHSLRRLAGRFDGELGPELERCNEEIAGGKSFPAALGALAARIDVVDFHRFAEAIILAVERGTPLAEVLVAQAGDLRAVAHRRLLEAAGHREVAMLVPIVFLVLPTVVLVALLPAAFGVTFIVA